MKHLLILILTCTFLGCDLGEDLPKVQVDSYRVILETPVEGARYSVTEPLLIKGSVAVDPPVDIEEVELFAAGTDGRGWGRTEYVRLAANASEENPLHFELELDWYPESPPQQYTLRLRFAFYDRGGAVVHTMKFEGR